MSEVFNGFEIKEIVDFGGAKFVVSIIKGGATAKVDFGKKESKDALNEHNRDDEEGVLEVEAGEGNNHDDETDDEFDSAIEEEVEKNVDGVVAAINEGEGFTGVFADVEGEVEVMEMVHDVEKNGFWDGGHGSAGELIANEEENEIAEKSEKEKTDGLGELAVGLGVGDFGEPRGKERSDAVADGTSGDGEERADGKVGTANKVVEKGFEWFHKGF